MTPFSYLPFHLKLCARISQAQALPLEARGQKKSAPVYQDLFGKVGALLVLGLNGAIEDVGVA